MRSPTYDNRVALKKKEDPNLQNPWPLEMKGPLFPEKPLPKALQASAEGVLSFAALGWL